MPDGGHDDLPGHHALSAPSLVRFYRGIVRNVEESLDPGLPDAKARIPDFAAKDQALFLSYLKGFSVLPDPPKRRDRRQRRKHFLDLRIGSNEWAIAPSLTGIHCNALKREDFDRLAGMHAGMVWSPLSNLMLYGQTADIRAAREAGVRIGIGSDWSRAAARTCCTN